MNDEYLRMKALLEGIGLSFDENGITNAEIYAYSVGMQEVKTLLDSVKNQVFMLISDISNIIKYADMFKIDMANPDGALLYEIIKARFSQSYGDFKFDDFLAYFNAICSGNYFMSPSDLAFTDISLDDLERLGKFIEAWCPINAQATSDGHGLVFMQWDEIAKSFYEYDKLHLPFSLLDTLRSDII